MVTRDVPANETVYGVPARKAGPVRRQLESDMPAHDASDEAVYRGEDIGCGTQVACGGECTRRFNRSEPWNLIP